MSEPIPDLAIDGAEHLDGTGECDYNCENPALYAISVDAPGLDHPTIDCCGECGEAELLYPVINDHVEPHPDDLRFDRGEEA